MEAVLIKRFTIRGFIVSDFDSQIDDFRRDVSSWLKAGMIKYKEDVSWRVWRTRQPPSSGCSWASISESCLSRFRNEIPTDLHPLQDQASVACSVLSVGADWAVISF